MGNLAAEKLDLEIRRAAYPGSALALARSIILPFIIFYFYYSVRIRRQIVFLDNVWPELFFVCALRFDLLPSVCWFAYLLNLWA